MSNVGAKMPPASVFVKFFVNHSSNPNLVNQTKIFNHAVTRKQVNRARIKNVKK